LGVKGDAASSGQPAASAQPAPDKIFTQGELDSSFFLAGSFRRFSVSKNGRLMIQGKSH
jgi:hypothetical protein